MTDQTPPKPLIGWLGEDVPSWGNFIMNRVNDREPFATEAGYGHLLSLLNARTRCFARCGSSGSG